MLRLLPLALLPILLISGCSGDNKEAEAMLDLKKLGFAYHKFYADNNRSPADVDELDSYMKKLANSESDVAFVTARIRGGSVIVVWNAALSQDGDANDKFILAYEKDLETDGGLVLWGGGYVEKKSAFDPKSKLIATQ